MSRIDVQRDAEPQLVADVWLYETADGGRAGPALPGFGCVLMTSKELPIPAGMPSFYCGTSSYILESDGGWALSF